jgi:hypothetical protein
MTNQPEPLDLDEVEARAGGLYEYATGLDTAWQEEADRLAGTDVPALVAEIRRLRAASEPAGAPVTAEQPAGVPESHPDRHSASQAPLRAPDGADIAAADNPTPPPLGPGRRPVGRRRHRHRPAVWAGRGAVLAGARPGARGRTA